MKIAIIENGIVVNTVIVDNDFTSNEFEWVESDLASIGDSYSEGAFTKPSLNVPVSVLKQLKAKELEQYCKLAIVAGISSSALGQPHTYPTDQTSQMNLTGLVTKSFLDAPEQTYKFWCADANGVSARVEHTKGQIQALGIDVANHVIACQDKYSAKLALLASANTANAINAIVW